jgi:tetratricopeptide (TPR) repeat protein
LIVARVFLLALLGALLGLGQRPQDVPPPPPDKPVVQAPVEEPPEEDPAAVPRTYDFNPIEAEKEVKVGKYYLKKGSLKAALNRFEDASKYNPQLAEAFLLLAETRQKLRDGKGAKEAYGKYLALSPDAKNAAEIKKRMEKLH